MDYNEWTQNLIFCKTGNTIIIVAYLNPNRKEELLNKTLWYARAYREKGYDIVIAGDFNYK